MNIFTDQHTLETEDMNSSPGLSRLGTNVTITPSHGLADHFEISLVTSDGVFSKPPGTLLNEGHDEHVDGPCWVAIQSESSVKKKWLKTLGQGVASYFALAQGREKYTLADFPSGYQMFDRVKNSNHTPYLFGYPTKSKLILKFRTANEFLPHLIWLASPSGSNKCSCRNCQCNAFRNDRRESSITSPAKIKEELKQENHENMNTIKEESKQENHENVNMISPDLHNRECLSSNFRVGELVWCEVDPKDTKVQLNSKYWPGMCQEIRVTLEPCEVLDLSAPEHPLNPPTPWKIKREVRKKRYWCIQLLGVSDRLTRIESQILPWLYHPFEESLWSAVSTGKLPLPGYLGHPSTPLPTLASLSNPAVARLSFQFALQIAGEIEESCAPAEHLEKVATYSYRPHVDRNVSQDSFSSKASRSMQLMKDLWLGAEKICTADLVRLKMLTNEGINAPAASPDCSKQVLFLHINFFWRLPCSDSVVVAGQIFELVSSSESSSVPAGNARLEHPKCTWLRRLADPAPRNLAISHPDEIPPPPKGFQFLKITPADKIHHLDMRCIAGRYYSPQSPHEGLRSLRHHFSTKKENSSTNYTKWEAPKSKQLKSLLGIRCGQENHMRICKMKASREEILQQALQDSRKMMSSHFRIPPQSEKP